MTGDIVYFVKYSWQSGTYSVGVGLDDGLADMGRRYVDYLVPADFRYINGVHIDEFRSEKEWHKLPKDWSYDTELFAIEDRTPEEIRSAISAVSINNSAALLYLVRKGYITRAKERFGGVVEAEIDRHKGWRIVKHYPYWTVNYANQTKTYGRYKEEDLFATFEEAKKKANELRTAREALLNLTDDEWSMMEIERVIRRFPEDEAGRYRQWVAEITKTVPVFDLVVRRFGGKLQWCLESDKLWREVKV